jgi:hypothetical protein
MADVRFTPDEIKQLVTSGQMTRSDLKLLHPADFAVAADAMVKSGQMEMMGAPLLPPGIANAAAGAASGIGDLVPEGLKRVLSMPSGLGGALKSGVGGYLGWEGAQAAGQMLNLPAPVRNILALVGAHFGSGLGRPGQGSAPAAVAEEAAPLAAPKARPDGGLPTTVKPGDYPPNVSTTRNSADVAEQVMGSSRNGYEDTHHSFNNEQYPLDQPSGQLLDKLKAALDSRMAPPPMSRPAVPTGFPDRGPVVDQLRNEAFDRVANRQGMGQAVVGQTPASTPNPRLDLGNDQPPEVERPIRSRRRKVSSAHD